ncbi:MAG: hypothetical protein LHV68_05125 [Elusimicrobia bacterium]|nr:hypothetical protein [Candidatus Liberimonas magnetica]
MKIDKVDKKKYFEVSPWDFEAYCKDNRIKYRFFDDYKEAESFHRENPEWKACTYIDAESKSLVIQGCHFINRLGYYFTAKKIEPAELSAWCTSHGIKDYFTEVR